MVQLRGGEEPYVHRRIRWAHVGPGHLLRTPTFGAEAADEGVDERTFHLCCVDKERGVAGSLEER